MDWITIALFGMLLTTASALVPASFAIERRQIPLAVGVVVVGLAIGLASPLINPFVSVLLGLGLMIVASLGIYVIMPKPTPQTNEPRLRVSAPDILAILAGALILFCFFFIPWYGRVVIDMDAIPQSLMARLYGASIRQLDVNYILNERYALQDFSLLMLILLIPTILALGVTVYGIFSPKIRPNVAKWTVWLAVAAFAYYLIYTLNSDFHLPVVETASTGFWVAFFGVILLAFQAFIPRPAVVQSEPAVQQRQIETVTAEGVIVLNTEHMTKSISNFGRALRRIRRDRLTLVAGSILLVLFVITFLSPWINQLVLGKDPTATGNLRVIEGRPMPVEPGGCTVTRGVQQCYILGSDQVGRDYLARVLEGGRISLIIAFASAILTATVGSILGMAAGYFGGVFDDFMNWVITTLNSLPQLYLLIAISAILRPDPTSLVIVFVVTGWTGSMRLIRGQTIASRGLDYVMAARALGASPWRIMFQHIFPNMISLLSVTLAIGIGGVILTEAALSFLNLGISPATPTWGNMLSKVQENLQGFFRFAPHIVIIPGVLISVTVLCLFIVGDGVRDAFDPTISD